MPTRKRSGTRSAASSTARPPDPLVFFLDESLDSETVAGALKEAGAVVVRATERFARGTLDESWLAEAGRNGWVVLTRDQRIRYRKLERLSLEAAGVRAFVFTGGNVTVKDTAAILAGALPAIARTVARMGAPFIVNIARSGALRRMA